MGLARPRILGVQVAVLAARCEGLVCSPEERLPHPPSGTGGRGRTHLGKTWWRVGAGSPAHKRETVETEIITLGGQRLCRQLGFELNLSDRNGK